MAACRYLVRGRVQGVGFRYFVQQQAARLGLRGWVRNLDDGRVEVHAEGGQEVLDELAGLLHRGPRWAEVRGVETAETAPEAGPGFEIL